MTARVLTDLDRIHAGGTPAPCEYRMHTRDGRVVWFRDEVVVMYDADGRPSGLYGIMLDISERRRVEAALADVRRRLADARDAERLRLARDLHDDAIQHLLGIGRLVDESQQRLAACTDVEMLTVVHAVALERIRAAVQAVATQVRGVIGELRPAGLDTLGYQEHVVYLNHELTALELLNLCTGSRRKLLDTRENCFRDISAPEWSSDGQYLAFAAGMQPLTGQIYLLNMRTNEIYQLTHLQEADARLLSPPTWSPDNSLLATTTQVSNNRALSQLAVIPTKTTSLAPVQC